MRNGKDVTGTVDPGHPDDASTEDLAAWPETPDHAGSGLLLSLVGGGHPDGPGRAGFKLNVVGEPLQQIFHGVSVVPSQGWQV
jgi:hypothetical protein